MIWSSSSLAVVLVIEDETFGSETVLVDEIVVPVGGELAVR